MIHETRKDTVTIDNHLFSSANDLSEVCWGQSFDADELAAAGEDDIALLMLGIKGVKKVLFGG